MFIVYAFNPIRINIQICKLGYIKKEIQFIIKY